MTVSNIKEVINSDIYKVWEVVLNINNYNT